MVHAPAYCTWRLKNVYFNYSELLNLLYRGDTENRKYDVLFCLHGMVIYIITRLQLIVFTMVSSDYWAPPFHSRLKRRIQRTSPQVIVCKPKIRTVLRIPRSHQLSSREDPAPGVSDSPSAPAPISKETTRGLPFQLLLTLPPVFTLSIISALCSLSVYRHCEYSSETRTSHV